MKRVTIVALLFCIGVASAKDLKTLDGRTYRNVRLSSKSPAGVQIMHSSGACYVPYSNMFTNDQREYGYDAAAASAFVLRQEEERKRREEAKALVPLDLSAILPQKTSPRPVALAQPRMESVAASPLVEEKPSPSRYSSDYSGKPYSGSKYANKSYSGGGSVQVGGYYRKDGTYVRPHTRRR